MLHLLHYGGVGTADVHHWFLQDMLQVRLLVGFNLVELIHIDKRIAECPSMGFRHSVTLPAKIRRQRLEVYLDRRSFITRIEYSRLTGLLKNLALKHLNALIEEGVLD